MEEIAKEAAAFLISQGPFGLLSLAAFAWGWIERRARDREVEAHNETREKRITEFKTIVDAIDRLEKSVDLIVNAFRAKV